ncbi:MAG: hypothetical protein WCG97_00275 [bacterium]
MRIPANLTFFIDDCHISAIIIPQSKERQNIATIFTSEKKSPRELGDKEGLTISLLKELCKDIRDWSSKAESRAYDISSTQVILSPSWYVSQTTLVLKESLKPIIFSETSILEANMENIPKNIEVFSSSKDLVLIEKQVSHVSLNGYPVASLNRQKATICKASVYYCYMNKRFQNLISECLKTLPTSIKKVSFQSLAKITTDNAKKALNDKNDLSTLKNGSVVIINFCSYITEIVYIHSETTVNILSLPFGYKETIHKMNKETGSDHAATESLLDLFLSGKLKPESRELVVDLLQKMGTDWAAMVMQGISQLPKSPNALTKTFVYALDKRQNEVAKIFTRLLPFNPNENITVSDFVGISA